MSFAGVLVNVATVLIGGLFGLLFKKAIPQRVTTAVMIGLGLCTLYIGIDGSMACHNILIVIAAMVLGGITGTALNIDGHINRLGDAVAARFRKQEGQTTIAEGFVTASLLYCIGAMTITWIKYKKPDVSMTLNGALAGLVGITAGCDMVTPVGAFCIGLISSVCVVFGIEFVDKVLHVDDPVGAVGVHGICGAVGTILTGVFAEESGLLYGGGFSFLGVQTLGVVVVILWVAVTCTAVFQLLKHTVGLRVSESEEITGLDLTEHGLVSETASFLPGRTNLAVTPELMAIADKSKEGEPAEADEAVEVIDRRVKKNADMHKITIITNENRFEYLKRNLEVIGVTGMTLTRVHGCGMQKGQAEYYRGVKVGMKLLPKIKVDIVVCKVPVEKVVGVAKLALFTGHYGDGKIFVYDVENVIKIRTGEEGYDALQDEADE